MSKVKKILTSERAFSIIQKPISTEKSTNLNQFNQYTFVVDKKLKDILSKLHTEIFVVDYQNLREINYDFQIPTGSLAKLLNIFTTDDIKFYKLSLPETKIKKKYIDNNKL